MTVVADFVRQRRAATVVAALVLLVIAVVALRSCGSEDTAPATGSEAVVPADALVYVHLSTARERPAVKRATELVEAFPSLPRLRDDLLGRIAAAGGPGVSFERDVEPWLGDEAALALLNARGSTAGSLIVLAVSDRAKAERFLSRVAGTSAGTDHRGTKLRTFGNVSTAFVGDDLVIGPGASVREAIDAHGGRSPSLARSGTYRRAVRTLPADRVADVYVSPDGVNRLLAPQAGALGVAGVLLRRPGLRGAAISLSPRAGGAALRVHSIVDPKAARAAGPPAKAFTPALLDDVPKGAVAYLGITRLDEAVKGLIGLSAAGGAQGARVARLLRRTQTDLARRTGVDLATDVIPLFQGETALWLAPAIPAPILTIITATRDEQATREAFAKLQEPLAKLFAPASTGAGQTPVFQERTVDGQQAFTLRLGPGAELNYAVFDRRLVISTSLQGIRAVKGSGGSLPDTGPFKATLGDRPKEVTSLLFLDFSELLTLGERTGLSDSRTYLQVRDDLKKVRAVGASATAGETESTTELFLDIP